VNIASIVLVTRQEEGMKLDINGHQVEVTPALREYAQEKIGRLSKHFDHHLDARMILSVVKLDHKAEATLHTTGKTLFADAVAPDMYAAIDLLADKLDRIVLKQKEKMTDHHRGDSPARADAFG
jgi:putative sigma-54 modulation protein